MTQPHQGWNPQGWNTAPSRPQGWQAVPPQPRQPAWYPGPAGPPPAWQPGGHQFQPPPPPRRGGGTGRAIVITVAAVAVVGLVAAVGLRFVLGGPGSADGPVSTTQAQPTPTYENSDFQVPAPNPNPSPAPAPQTWEEVDQFMKQNALYDVTLREPVECPGTGIDPSTATLQEKGAYYNQLTECLVRVWAPSAAEVGFDVHRPYITMYDGPITTKCGTFKDTANGFYCDADGQIYIGSMDWSMVPAELQATRMNGDATMGHEFGHLVQDRTGIIGALRSFQYKNKGTPLELEYNRRLEQQADCFGGLFINSIAQSRRITDEERRLAGTLARSFGAAPGSTHGTPNSREYWTLEGVDTAEIKACNTFVVPSSQVE